MPRAPLVVPVRFTIDGKQVQCATREVGADGVLVGAPPPPPGTRLSLLIYLAGSATPEEIEAVVGAAVDGGGFVAEFLPGFADSRARIAAAIAGVPVGKPTAAPAEGPAAPARREALSRREPHSVPAYRSALAAAGPGPAEPRRTGPTPANDESVLPPGAERRTAPRLRPEKPLPVRFATVDDFVLEYAANISVGGVFIATPTPPAMRSIVRVMIELPDGGPPAEVQAMVTHRVEPGGDREAGAGVQFLQPDSKFTERIEKFVDRLLEAKRGKREG